MNSILRYGNRLLRNWCSGILLVLFISTGLFGQGQPQKVVIRAISGLQYDTVRVKLKPGVPVELVLQNMDEMAHNLVVTAPGKREAVVEAALQMGAEGEAKGFVPESPHILTAIPVLNPDEEQSVRFEVPEKEGVYPFVCTYPGHGAVMYGAFYVTENKLPNRATDLNIPPKRRTSEAIGKTNDVAEHSGHPYPSRVPTIYRTFMPNSGPASIAVRLFKDYAYCWDAGTCAFRYFWKGGFLDMERTWGGKGKERAEIVGVVVYRERPQAPFRIGDRGHLPKAEFKGYRLKNRFPTFLYELDGVAVTERIMVIPDRPGLKRMFTMQTEQPVWLKLNTAVSGIRFEADSGQFKEGFLYLSPEEAASFTLYMVEE